MDPESIGAVIGGVMGGAAAAGAVALDRRLQTRFDRRTRLEVAADSLDAQRATTVERVGKALPDEVERLYERAERDMRVIDRLAGAAGVRAAGAIRVALDALVDVWSSLLARSGREDIAIDERSALDVAMLQVHRAVHGMRPIDMASYRPSAQALVWQERGARPDELPRPQSTYRAVVAAWWRRHRQRRLARRRPYESGRQLGRDVRELHAVRAERDGSAVC